MNPVGVALKETKQILDAMIALGHGIEASYEDGKLSFTDIPNFIEFLTLILPAIEGADQVPFEFKVADPEDIAELKEYLQANLDLRDDELEAFIEDAFKVALDIYMLYKLYFMKEDTTNGDEVTPPADGQPVE